MMGGAIVFLGDVPVAPELFRFSFLHPNDLGERAGTGAGAGVHAIGPVGLQVDGQPKFSTVGSGTVLAGTSSATILNTNITAGSHISVTLTSDPGNTAAVVRVTRAAGVSFSVRLSSNVGVDTRFTYFIVEPT